jgi:hypothetical protein
MSFFEKILYSNFQLLNMKMNYTTEVITLQLGIRQVLFYYYYFFLGLRR